MSQPSHKFQGPTDRWCEICDKPDRDPIHAPERTAVRYILNNKSGLAVKQDDLKTTPIPDVIITDDGTVYRRQWVADGRASYVECEALRI